jgi:putative hydrolase of the HAD superfamily
MASDVNKAVVFDLDDTLYDSSQYWLGAFKDISQYLYKEHKVSRKKSYQFLVKLYKEKTSSYSYLFDDLVKYLKLGQKNLSTDLVKQLVSLFHQHQPSLRLYRETLPVLKALKAEFKIGLITNGRFSTQKKKIKALKIGSYFDVIICPRRSKRKPSIKPYVSMAKKLKVKLNQMVYIGDNPKVDFKGAKDCGFKTIRLKKGPFKNTSVSRVWDADYCFDNLSKISSFLEEKL